MQALLSMESARRFELVVRTHKGDIRTLDISANDPQSARARAIEDGLQVLACHPRKNAPQLWTGASHTKSTGLDIANFSFEMASLLSAGLSVTEALRTLAAKESGAGARLALLDIEKGVNEGQPLSMAMQRHSGRYPPLLIASISASEQTGDLSTALRRYAEHQLTIRSLRDKVVGASVYPVLLLAIGCLVVAFLMVVVVPKFAVLIESSRHELPWSSQLLMSWGRFAARYSLAIGIIVLAAFFSFGLIVRKIFQNGGKAGWIEAIPFIGPSMRQFRHSQLYRTTGMLVKGGIAVPQALSLGTSLLGEADQSRLRDAIRLIHEGQNLSVALERSQLADPVATSMLAVAERTGSLAEILERIAQFHESRLQRTVELTSRLFEPILMITIGLLVGAIVVLMYLPIFDLASSLQ